jgi:electron transfer flavoprotein alpha subunit
MGDLFVVAEHRQGELRDITFEMLFKAGAICREYSHTLTAVLLGPKDSGFPAGLSEWADRVIAFEDDRLTVFDADLYKGALQRLIREHEPLLTLIGHTPWGMALAPALSVSTGCPLATDCVDILLEEGHPTVIRQIYSGKLFSRVAFKTSNGYMVTVRPGAFLPTEARPQFEGEVIQKALDPEVPGSRKEFVEFVDTGAGEVDITQADLLVSVGRGVGDAEHIEPIRELADLMGATLSCSRPVVDKHWLPKYHQVGTSGKSVKPKVYLALGISGAFQHVAGIAGAGTVIAVNKDGKAPIFRVADYGVVDDLFHVVDALKEKLAVG